MPAIMDPTSPTWMALRRLIDERIEKAREALELPGMAPEGLRGEIAALRWVKKTVEPDPPITESTGEGY